jgi:hypothetical protein
MAKTHLRLVAPTEVNRTVRPKRQKNAELRTREHLTPDELGESIEAAKCNRYGHRDAIMILLAFRHGLRAAGPGRLRQRRAARPPSKERTPSTHPIQGDEMRALRRLRRESPTSPFVFVSERPRPASPG